MREIEDWLGSPIQLAESKGGVLAFVDPFGGLLRGQVSPWPPPSVVQKLYQSRQESAFSGPDGAAVTSSLGFYSDLQSVHSEDAITWSVFGPVAHASPEVRSRFVAEFFDDARGCLAAAGGGRTLVPEGARCVPAFHPFRVGDAQADRALVFRVHTESDRLNLFHAEAVRHNRLHSGIYYLPPAAMLNGSAEKILRDRDRKLEQARKRRQQNYLAQKQKTQNEKSIEAENSQTSSQPYALLVSG